jgi:hypothetical protein
MRISFIIGYLFICLSLYGQDSSKQVKLELSPNSYQRQKNRSKNRIVYTAIGNVIIYGGTMDALYKTWYKNYPQSKFHFFNDNKEWLQVDKAGHAWSAYAEGRTAIKIWQWAGLPRKKSIWIGGLSGLGYQTIIEVLDGFSSQWGFSWGDYLGNMTGTALLIGQDLGWKEQRIQFKFSSYRRSYGSDILNQRVNDIYGINLPQRILKDYNAQTYWLSTNVHSFFKSAKIPDWFNIAVGYGADGMLGAVDNKWVGKNGILNDYSGIKRFRQLYIAPDIDLSKIRTKSKFLKTTFFILNNFKLPTPALELSNNKIKCNWINF